MPVRLLKLLISLVVMCCDKVAAAFAYLVGQPSAKCVILYYHAVRDEVSRKFAAQMDVLARLSIPIDLEAREPPQLQRGLRYSAVTFDDAFMSVVQNALPTLAERNIPCTIFVPTGSLGRRPGWIESMHEDGMEEVFSVDVLKEVARRPLVRLGSHSVSHPNFREIADDEARSQLLESKSTLERITGREVTTFSFPHGAHTQRSLDLVRQCGYAQAYTIVPLQLGDPRTAFVVGRVRVEPHDWPIEFRLKVLGAYRWMASASRMKRSLRRFLGKDGTQTQHPQAL